jgi:GNAT superfamily N-acetyltransferase
MKKVNVSLHSADNKMLDDINALIEAAIMTWNLPERVKRLTLPSYRYSEQDMLHLEMVIARVDQTISGVAAWEEADSNDTPDSKTGLLLHGIYVDPDLHNTGIGTRLFQAAEQAMQGKGLDGLLVKAQSGAEAFFEKQGMNRLPVDAPNRHYANRFWKAAKPG